MQMVFSKVLSHIAWNMAFKKCHINLHIQYYINVLYMGIYISYTVYKMNHIKIWEDIEVQTVSKYKS